MDGVFLCMALIPDGLAFTKGFESVSDKLLCMIFKYICTADSDKIYTFGERERRHFKFIHATDQVGRSSHITIYIVINVFR